MPSYSPTRRARALAAALALCLVLPAAARAQSAADLPSFSNEEQSCVLYGDWAVNLMRRADAMGCDFDNARDWFTARRHANWCMGQSGAAMRRQAQVHWNNMISRCARRDVDFVAGLSGAARPPVPPQAAAPQPMPVQGTRAPELPAFSNEEQSCVLYGDWAVQEIRRAQGLRCDTSRSNESLDPSLHTNWCMRQSEQSMRRAPLILQTRVAFTCAQQGIDVRRR